MEVTPVQIKEDVTERSRTLENSPGEDHLPKDQGSPRKQQASAPEKSKRSDRGIQALQ